MRYCFTTLAIGDKYEKSAIKLFSELKIKTEFADFNITTTNQKLPIKKTNDFIKWYVLSENTPTHFKKSFYYNLKSLSLKPFIEDYNENNEYKFIIYIDSDWSVNCGFEESKMLNLFNYMEENDIDMIYERPGLVKDHKKNPNSFVLDKLIQYGVNEHTKWDEVNVMNEQFVVYRNNWKFRFYTRRWEQFLWYSVKNEINNFGEGLEMGISSVESEMNVLSIDKINHIIREIFYFHNANGTKFIRY